MTLASSGIISIGGSTSNRSINLELGRSATASSNLNETRFILPTGQSGLPSSPHYRDQAELYHRGGYRKTWFSETYIKSEKTFKHLKLIPR